MTAARPPTLVRRAWRVGLASAAALLLLTARPLLAAERPELPAGLPSSGQTREEIKSLETRLHAITLEVGTERGAGEEDAATRRLVEAQAKLVQKDDAGAAMLLRILADDPDTARSPVRLEALLLLGETLVRLGDLASARVAFDEAVTASGGAEQRPALLERLFNLAHRAGGQPRMDELLARLGKLPPADLTEGLRYHGGKHALLAGALDYANGWLAPLPPESPYYPRARYLLGAAAVKAGNLEAALPYFEEVAARETKDAEEHELNELAVLAVARVHHARGDFDRAWRAYGQLPAVSKHFIESRHEAAYAAIAGGDFGAAQRAIDLLLEAAPGHAEAPELHMLRANLLVRQEAFSDAHASFVASLRVYEPLHRDLTQSRPRAAQAAAAGPLPTADPPALASRLGVSLTTSQRLTADPAVARAAALEREAAALGGEIAEGEKLVAELDRTLERDRAGEGRLSADLTAARGRAATVLGEALVLRRRLLGDLTKLAGDSLTGGERTALARLDNEQARLEPQVRRPSDSLRTLSARERATRGRLHELEQRRTAVDETIARLEQQLAELGSGPQPQPPGLAAHVGPDPVARVRSEIDALRATSAGLQTQLKGALDEESPREPAEDPNGPDARLRALVRRSCDVLLQARARLGTFERQSFDERFALLDPLEDLFRQVANLDQAIEGRVVERLRVAEKALAGGRQALGEARGRASQIGGESRGAGHDTMVAAVERWEKRAYSLAVQSDVGLLDVVWGRKNERTRQISEDVAAQKKLLKTLQDDLGKEPLLDEFPNDGDFSPAPGAPAGSATPSPPAAAPPAAPPAAPAPRS